MDNILGRITRGWSAMALDALPSSAMERADSFWSSMGRKYHPLALWGAYERGWRYADLVQRSLERRTRVAGLPALPVGRLSFPELLEAYRVGPVVSSLPAPVARGWWPSPALCVWAGAGPTMAREVAEGTVSAAIERLAACLDLPGGVVCGRLEEALRWDPWAPWGR